MAFEVEGTIKVIMDIQTFSSGFTKREFVITVGDDRYPQDIKMEFVKDKTALLEKFRPGTRVKVGFDLRGGEHNGRYYVNLQAWRIQPADGSEGPADSGESRPRSTGTPRPAASPGRPFRGGDDQGGGRDRDSSRRPRNDDEFRGRRRSHSEDDIDF